jgi:hypothetical protein
MPVRAEYFSFAGLSPAKEKDINSESFVGSSESQLVWEERARDKLIPQDFL